MPTEAPRTVRDLLSLGRDFLGRKGIESPRLEVELLVAHALETDRLHVFLELDRLVDEDEVARAREYIVRRGKNEPSAYITGTREFYVRPFEVGPGVLIPRPETELLVDLGRDALANAEAPSILDVGTGSGCLAVTLALEVEGARVTAVDVSAEALVFARRNAERLGAAVEFLEGDGAEPVRGRRFDLVVSNPPYVDPEATTELAADVAAYEPAQALYAPTGDPDHWLKRLASDDELLAPGGTLLVELGYDQSERARAWLASSGLKHTIHADLAGVDRVVRIVRD